MNVQNGQGHVGPARGVDEFPDAMLPEATLPGLDGGGELAAINCSKVAHCSDLDHSVAAVLSFFFRASSNGLKYSFIGNISIVAM